MATSTPFLDIPASFWSRFIAPLTPHQSQLVSVWLSKNGPTIDFGLLSEVLDREDEENRAWVTTFLLSRGQSAIKRASVIPPLSTFGPRYCQHWKSIVKDAHVITYNFGMDGSGRREMVKKEPQAPYSHLLKDSAAPFFTIDHVNALKAIEA